jgi:hypothetical protein
MKKYFLASMMILLTASALFSADLDPGYRKAFGNGVIIATNGEYPPVTSFDASQFVVEKGAFSINISPEIPVNLRAILPAGKKWRSYYDQAVKEQKENLKYKEDNVFYWQVWTNVDEDGNLLDPKKHPWPAKVSDIPNWEPEGWFYGIYGSEAGDWETVGMKEDDFRENAFKHFFTAKPGQKFYITVSVGYKYIADAGKIESKWNSVLNKFEPVQSTGEMGFVMSKPICGGTILVKTNSLVEE